jgi:hypothetical protein
MVRLLACAVASLALTLPAAAARERAQLEAVATNLNNPRKLFLTPDDRLYVAEAGTGGQDLCFGTGPDSSCVGLTGSVTRIAGGRQTRVVTGLVSWASPTQQRAQGIEDVQIRGGTSYLLFGDAFLGPHGRNRMGRDGASAGRLIARAPGRTRDRLVADLAAFEAAHNPDRGAGSNAKLRNPTTDSNPYAFTAYRGGFAVADAAANDLLWISPAGEISVLATFPTRDVPLTRADAQRIGASATMTSITVQAVPTSVVVGPDGALYVGELTGRPYPVGGARVWRIVPGRPPSIYASGFTTISDLAFDGPDLLVLEIARRGLYDPNSSGALIRVAPSGRRTVLATKGLIAPTGLAVGRDRIYVSNHGFSPGVGPGPHGQVVSLDA